MCTTAGLALSNPGPWNWGQTVVERLRKPTSCAQMTKGKGSVNVPQGHPSHPTPPNEAPCPGREEGEERRGLGQEGGAPELCLLRPPCWNSLTPKCLLSCAQEDVMQICSRAWQSLCLPLDIRLEKEL